MTEALYVKLILQPPRLSALFTMIGTVVLSTGAKVTFSMDTVVKEGAVAVAAAVVKFIIIIIIIILIYSFSSHR